MNPDYLQWIELSKSNLFHNIQIIRSLLPQTTALSALLKANAYGHGLEEMASLYDKGGVLTFMVHSFSEAMRAWSAVPKARIIILGPMTPSENIRAIHQGFEWVTYDLKLLNLALKKTVKTDLILKVHLKIETGTHRQGIFYKDLPAFIRLIRENPRIRVSGVSSHFANIEDTSDKTYFKHQLDLFEKALSLFHRNKISTGDRHIACSAAVFLHPETHYDLVRPGISLCGYLSSPELAYALRLPTPLKPVLSWKTRLAQIKTISPNEGVGYGLTFKTSRKTKLGILPIGYYDGFDRNFSNTAYVLIRGKRAPIRGRICMNLCMADLTDIPEAKLHDEVVLLGKQGNEEITADHLATLSHTISYEILARLNPCIPKIIV